MQMLRPLWVCALLLVPACGGEPASEPRKALRPHEFRDVLRQTRNAEWEVFATQAQRLVRGAFDGLADGVAQVAASDPSLAVLLQPVPARPAPIALEALAPLPSGLPERLDALARAALPQLSPEQLAGFLENLIHPAVQGIAPYLARSVEDIQTPLQELKVYAAPGGSREGEAQASLYAWLRDRQRRSLSKAVPMDVRIGDHLSAGAPWSDGSYPVTICLERMAREVLRAADMRMGLLLPVKYGAPERFESEFAAMLEATRDAYVRAAVSRLHGAWYRAVFALDTILTWEFDPASAPADTANPIAHEAADASSRGVAVVKRPEDASAPATKGKDHALLIAVNDYDHWTKLANPIADATALKEVLEREYGFETQLVTDVTQAALKRVVDEYARKTFAPNDQLLVFYAGHGYWDEVRDRSYLVLKDAPRQAEFGAASPGYEPHEAFLEALPSTRNCKHMLVMWDACFAGAYFESQMDARIPRGGPPDVMSDVPTETLLRRKLPYTTRKLITSGGKEYVFDGGAGGHSPFADRLLRQLRGTNSTASEVTTFHQILASVAQTQPSGAHGGSLANDHPMSDFFFVRRGRPR